MITNECYVIQFTVNFDNNGAVKSTDFHSRELTKCNKMLIIKNFKKCTASPFPGSIMDTGGEAQASKHSDLSTLKSTLEAAVRAHYPAVANHIAVRLIPCRSVCSETLALLSRLVNKHLHFIYTRVCELYIKNTYV